MGVHCSVSWQGRQSRPPRLTRVPTFTILAVAGGRRNLSGAIAETTSACGLGLVAARGDVQGARILVGFGLRQLQDTLNRKADAIQREFVELSGRLEALSKKLIEARGDERDRLRAEHAEARARQAELAEVVNLWRDRARSVLQQRSETSLRTYLEELMGLEDEELREATQQALKILDAPPGSIPTPESSSSAATPRSTAGRLLERARTSWDLRGSDSSVRMREAVEFSNRPGMAQDDSALAELEGALDDPDPLVREIAVLAAIQLHRFRAMRVADLDRVHESVKSLAGFNHPAVIPVLIEVVENPRTGFAMGESEPIETDNNRSRMVALLRLVEWHTSDAQAALRLLRFDRDPNIVRAAVRALELFPDEWRGPIKSYKG